MCKAGIQTEACHDHTHAVGSDYPQQVRLRGGKHLLLELEPVLSQLSEPGRDNNGSLGAPCPELGNQGGHLVGGCRNNGKIGRLGQTCDIWVDLQPVQASVPRIDQIEPPLEAACPQVAKSDCANRARTRGGPNQGDGARGEYFVEVAN